MASSEGIRYQKTTLPDGLRIVTEKVPTIRSIAIGVWINVGSRNEEKQEAGISHFIEHMAFKGTTRRSAKEIASFLESLGGSLNAFTSREQTCYHALVLDEHLEQAVDILADITLNPSLSLTNLEREKSVVIEEIQEVEETPSENVHELFSESFWRGQPIGRPIMGNRSNIRRLNRSDLIRFREKHYRSGDVVIAAAGNISHKKLVELVRKRFHFPRGSDSTGKNARSPEKFLLRLFNKKASQTHLCLGFPGVKFDDARRNTMLAIHTYLGGGMSSVLFQKIREEKGIAYSVYTFPDFYKDNGLIGVYLAADRRRLKAALEIIFRELRKLKKERIPEERLAQVKEQMKGNTTLGLESAMSRMIRLGRFEIMAEKYLPLGDTLRAINKITSDEIISMARQIFIEDRLTVTLLGSATENDLRGLDWTI
ncbi:MAG: pitrilysin family protein [Candidatus Zixiibacteriota bacterium]